MNRNSAYTFEQMEEAYRKALESLNQEQVEELISTAPQVPTIKILSASELQTGVTLEDNTRYEVDVPITNLVLNGANGKGILRFDAATNLVPIYNNIAVKSAPSSYEAGKTYDIEYYNNTINISNGFVFPQKKRKVLMISNSFGVDVTENIINVSNAAGIDTLYGVAYIAGCSMAKHYANMQAGGAAYTYYKRDSESGKSTINNQSLIDMISSEDWDIITLQSVSDEAGEYDKNAPYIQAVIDYAKLHCPNKNVKFMWYQTWAYSTDSTHSGFAKYDNSQLTMYNAIADVSKRLLDNFPDFSAVIPCGTTIQNCRTSAILNAIDRELTIDGYHLGTLGEVPATYTMFNMTANIAVSQIDYSKVNIAGWTSEFDVLAKQAVTTAIADKFQITYIDEPTVVDKSALQATINSTSSLVESDYTTESWSAMEQSLSTANNVLASSSATQVEVDNANSNLTTAINNLVPVAPSEFTEFTNYTKVQGFCSLWSGGVLTTAQMNSATNVITEKYNDAIGLKTPASITATGSVTIHRGYTTSRRPLSLPAGTKIVVTGSSQVIRLCQGTTVGSGGRGDNLTGNREIVLSADSIVMINTVTSNATFLDNSALTTDLATRIKILVPTSKFAQANNNEV